jgi:hypothetical protein
MREELSPRFGQGRKPLLNLKHFELQQIWTLKTTAGPDMSYNGRRRFMARSGRSSGDIHNPPFSRHTWTLRYFEA